MKTYNFFPNSYDPATVEGIKEKFSWSLVEKAGLPKFDHTGNLRYPIEITQEKLDQLLFLREEEIKFQRRFADIKEPLQVLGWSVLEDNDNYYGFGKKLQIKVIINGKEVDLYSSNMEYTIARAIYDLNYVNLRFSVRRNRADSFKFDEKSHAIYIENKAIEDAFSHTNNFGNHNDLKNEAFIDAIISFIKENEVDICKAFGYKTKTEIEQLQKKRAEAEEIERIAFENAKPDDMVNSGYGYMVKKKDYAKAQRMGFDGIENI
jgi:hypothetical protein